jgi:hypothetical protein
MENNFLSSVDLSADSDRVVQLVDHCDDLDLLLLHLVLRGSRIKVRKEMRTRYEAIIEQ